MPTLKWWLNFQTQHGGWRSSGSQDKKQLSPSTELRGWRSCSSGRVFSVWGGREGFLGGWGVDAGQDLKAIEVLSHKVSLHARA